MFNRSIVVLLFSFAAWTCAASRPIAHVTPPPLLGEIRCNDWAACVEPDHEFSLALQRRFPTGTSESDLQAILLREGFSRAESYKTPAHCMQPERAARVAEAPLVCPDDRNSRWSPNVFHYWWAKNAACSDEIVVLWTTDSRGSLTHIEGRFDGGCI